MQLLHTPLFPGLGVIGEAIYGVLESNELSQPDIVFMMAAILKTRNKASCSPLNYLVEPNIKTSAPPMGSYDSVYATIVHTIIITCLPLAPPPPPPQETSQK